MKTQSLILAGLLALSLSGCVVINENVPESRASSSESETSTSKASVQESRKEESSSAQNKESTTPASETPAPVTPSTPAVNDQFAQKVKQAFVDAGYSILEEKSTLLDNGNNESVYSIQIEGNPSTVFVTDAASSDLAGRTFAANEALDQRNDNFTIMSSGQNGSKKIEVIRNNMANLNYVEAIDTDQAWTVHIINQTPEQLDPVLKVMENLGYPYP